MCLIYEAADLGVEAPPEEMQKEFDAYAEFTKDIAERGLHKGGEALQPPMTATTVRVQEGETLTTDGPYAETKEWLAGFYVVECQDLDEAIEVAARIPSARHGAIEVRPVMDMPADYAS